MTLWETTKGTWFIKRDRYLCKDVRIYYRFPLGDIFPAEQKLLLHIPGDERDVSLLSLVDIELQADIANVVLVALRFKKGLSRIKDTECVEKVDRFRNFPKPFGYQWGNLGYWDSNTDVWLQKFADENTIFKHIEHAQEVFFRNTKPQATGVYYFGYSAGAQLVNRHVILGEESYFTNHVHKVCTASAKSYTFPTQLENFGGQYPHSLVSPLINGTEVKLVDVELVNRVYTTLALKLQSLPVLITVGEEDDKKTKKSDELYTQGATRVDRANNFFAYLLGYYETNFRQETIEANETSEKYANFNWRKSIFPETSHELEVMWKPCWNHLFDTRLTVSQQGDTSGSIPQLDGYHQVCLTATLVICALKRILRF